ncbi:MAG: hypothetical protein IPP79_19880 [Chitinophagaceae bacterium]|nr:hypothetical protein [Chitinophagaceae bacterium]
MDNEFHYYANFTYAKMYFTTPTGFSMKNSRQKDMIKDENGNVIGYSRKVNGKEYPMAKKITNIDTLKLANQLFGDIAWYLFEIKNYKESLAYFKRGTQVYPEDLNMLVNMAHLYLF